MIEYAMQIAENVWERRKVVIRLFSILSAISLAFAPVGELPYSEGGAREMQTNVFSFDFTNIHPYYSGRMMLEKMPDMPSFEEIPALPDAPVKLDQAPPVEDEIYFTEAQIAQYRQSVEEKEAQRRAEEEERIRLEEEQKRQQEAMEQAAQKAKLTIEQLREMGLDENAKYLGTYKLTAYCPCYLCCGKYPDDPTYGMTASGEIAQEGITIAMDKLPFGTKVYIENVGVRIVQDRGGAIKGNRIDIFCATHERCFENPNYVQSAARVWILPDEDDAEVPQEDETDAPADVEIELEAEAEAQDTQTDAEAEPDVDKKQTIAATSAAEEDKQIEQGKE